MRRLTLTICVVVLSTMVWSPNPVTGQHLAEVEIERKGGTTASRFEAYDGSAPLIRAERELGPDPIQRAGIKIPGPALGMDGYVSLFLEDLPGHTGYGVAFEIGRGVPMLGGSVERADDRYAGLYLKLRRPNLEFAFGGGDRNGDLIGHAGIYAKGTRWSAALGGARGPHAVNFEHFAATWHPLQRGAAPGARLIGERRTDDRYAVELTMADRANFNHFAVWGQFGMDQWPHRKTFEAVDDIMRYVRPPILYHEYTSGAGVLTGRHEVRDGNREITLDARIFPLRALLGWSGARDDESSSGVSGYLVSRVLPTIMVGGMRKTQANANKVVGELRFPPFGVYAEVPTRKGTLSYLFIQFRRGLPF